MRYIITTLIIYILTLTGVNATESVDILINNNTAIGNIEISNGKLNNIKIIRGKGEIISESSFDVRSSNWIKLRVVVENERVDIGPSATQIFLQINVNKFSFFLRDVDDDYPIYIPKYGVIILKRSDRTTFNDIEKSILEEKKTSKLQQITSKEEESFSSVKAKVRDMSAPTWLGISRDARIFEVTSEQEDQKNILARIVRPKISSSPIHYSYSMAKTAAYLYALGRGVSVENNISRHLENGTLPILNTTLKDDKVTYTTTSFVTLENSFLTDGGFGTSFWVGDYFSGGHMFTEDQKEIVDVELENFKKEDSMNKTVLFSRTVIRNNDNVPRYAFLKVPRPGDSWQRWIKYEYDNIHGFSKYTDDEIFCISMIDGKPLPNEEMSVLINPGQSIEFIFYLPHTPISSKRAKDLSSHSYVERYKDSKSFWTKKINRGAKISVPEKRIDEMIQAGLLHLDLITYGKDPEGTLAPCIGVYSPIGTESAPIIQFYASMGWTDVAKRSLDYFLEKQHENGFMQNFGGYMVETGAALWTMGEYFRYTNDIQWVKQNKDKLIKSCEYLINWRNKNKIPELKGKGYGMIDGKVADPVDPFHQFMLNGFGYLGIKRVVEMLKEVSPKESNRLKREADGWKKDIRESFFASMGRSPVIPLGDGTWSPTISPWPEKTGLRVLFTEKENFWTHGTFTSADALLGPLYLVFCEVVDIDEDVTKMMLDYHSELFFQGNSALSQPYYSRHNWLQAKLGMVKPFLNTYYNTMAAHADRETYTFWEHLYRVSPHKTHEEAWFLMETRWMLYLEEGDTLSLLKTIPRKWMEDGKEIVLEGVQSYFGSLDLLVESHIDEGYIEAQIGCREDERKPSTIQLRIPHPENKIPKKVIGGIYEVGSETITIKNITNRELKVRVEY